MRDNVPSYAKYTLLKLSVGSNKRLIELESTTLRVVEF